MPKKRKHGGARRTGRQESGHPARRAAARRTPSILHRFLRDLDEDDITAVLHQVSALIWEYARDGGNPAAFARLVTGVSTDPARSVPAVLAVLGELAHLDLDRAVARQAFRTRMAEPIAVDYPEWPTRLADLEVHACQLLDDELRSTSMLIIDALVPAAGPFSFVLHLNHCAGAVEEADLPGGWLTEDMPTAEAFDIPTTVRQVSPAEARSIAAHALGDLIVGDEDNDASGWPALSPLWQWLINHLPEGGPRYPSPRLAPDPQQILADFLASPYAARLTDPADPDIARVIVDALAAQPRCEPTLIAVRDLGDVFRALAAQLADATRATKLRCPSVLRAYTEWAHHRVGISPASTDIVLAEIDSAELVMTGALPAYLWDPGLEDFVDDADLDADTTAADSAAIQLALRRELRRAVGGEHALHGLDAEPLPYDETFDWTCLADEADRPYVAEALALLDRMFPVAKDDPAGTLFDDEGDAAYARISAEHRTAARRLLASVVRGVTRASLTSEDYSAATLAAGVGWLTWRANLVKGRTITRAKDIAAVAGLKRVPYKDARALLVLAHPGRPKLSAQWLDDPYLGDPALYVSDRRAVIVGLHAQLSD